MADFSASPVTGPSPSFLQSLALPSNIANTQAQTALMGAQGQYYGAQTQGETLANQITAMKLLASQGYANPQGVPAGAAAPNAPSSAPATAPSSGGGAASAPSGSPGSIPDSDDPARLTDPGFAAAYAASRFQVPAVLPLTASEQAKLHYAQQLAALGDPSALNTLMSGVQMRTAQAKAQSQAQSNSLYNTASQIAQSPHPYTSLGRVGGPDADPELQNLYAHITKLGEENHWTPEQLDDYTKKVAETHAGALYQYTGREVKTDTNGVARDDQGNILPNIPQAVTPAQVEAATQRRGQEQTAITEQRGQNISAGTAGSAMPLPPISVLGGAGAPAAPGPGGLPPMLARAAPPAAPATAPPASAGGAQPKADNGMLPGVDVTKFPAAPIQTPADAKAVNAAKYSALSDSNTAAAADQKESALIRAAQTEAANLANNPRMTGPGSDIAQAWAQFKTFISEQPPDALIDQGELDKMLLQMGAQNIRGALSGQRITNQEFMTLMTKGNPNTDMPLPTIRRLLGYLGTQNDYDQRFQRTKQAALHAGADPTTIDTAIGGIADRGDYVQKRTGVRPGLGGATATGPQEGATGMSKSGRPTVFTGGQWRYVQ